MCPYKVQNTKTEKKIAVFAARFCRFGGKNKKKNAVRRLLFCRKYETCRHQRQKRQKIGDANFPVILP